MSCACASCSVDTGNTIGSRARLASRLLVIRFIASAVFFASGIMLPFVLPVTERIVFVMFAASWSIAGWRVALAAIRNVFRGRVFDENFLMTVSTVGAFIIGEWTEGAAVMLFYNLGELFQEMAVDRSRRSIRDLVDVRPDTARQESDGMIVHPSVVAEGTVLRVLPGEKIPLDGTVTSGQSTLDSSSLTGESLPKNAAIGDTVYAGSVNLTGVLCIRTTSVYSTTAAARMLELIEGAQQRKARAERLITSFARVYTPIVTASAVFLALVPPIVLSLYSGAGFPPSELFVPWIYRALVFLVISCPCAFVISVPLGYFGGIGAAAKRGILVKGADYLDVLARTRAVVFDKTGTLTHGVFAVSSVQGVRGVTEDYLLSRALICEEQSNHPLARAVVSYAETRGIRSGSLAVHGVEERPGYGISVRTEAGAVIAGSLRFMEAEGVDISAITGDGTEEPGSVMYIAENGTLLGHIVLADIIKEESSQAVDELRTLGITHIAMVSGDTIPAARHIARQAGITEVHAGVLPDGKVSIFERFAGEVKAQYPKGTVLFVGDGINDAPVLARSDAGIAMGGVGSDAAVEAADVVLMTDNPRLIAESVRSARWTRHIVIQNIAVSFIVKIGFLVLGAFGLATLWEAVFADVGVALIATVNALRERK